MISLWKDALAALNCLEGELSTPWGTVLFEECLASVEQRLSWLRSLDTDDELGALWEMPRPEWGLK